MKYCIRNSQKFEFYDSTLEFDLIFFDPPTGLADNFDRKCVDRVSKHLEFWIQICSECIFVICTQLDFASISFFAILKNIYKIFVSSYFGIFIPKSVILNQIQHWLLYRFLSRDHSRAWVVIFIIYSVVSVYKLYMLIILDKNEYNYTKNNGLHPFPLCKWRKKAKS